MSEWIRHSRNLIHIDFSSNDMTAEGGKALFSMLCTHDSITSVNVASSDGSNRNRIGVGGAHAVSQALEQNPILTILDLQGNSLSQDGTLALCKGLAGNETLIHLNVASNDVDGRPMKRFMKSVAYSNLK
jgi:hypothetical protein